MLPSEMLKALQPKFEQARAKLSTLEGHPLVRLPEKVRYLPATLGFKPPSLRPGILDALHRALTEERRIDAAYAPFNSPPKELRLHPLSLVQRGTVPYLVATAFDYEDVRLFAVHRFDRIELTDEPIRAPENYSVDRALERGLMDFGSAGEIKLRARVSPELATYLSETPLSDDQRISYRRENWVLSATVWNSWQLHFWILSQGPALEVVRPVSLRRYIASQLRAALRQYEPTEAGASGEEVGQP